MGIYNVNVLLLIINGIVPLRAVRIFLYKTSACSADYD